MDKLAYLKNAIAKLEGYIRCEEDIDLEAVVKELKCMAFDMIVEAEAEKAEAVEEELVDTAEPETL